MVNDWIEYKIDDLKAPVKGSIAMGPFGSRIKAENFVTEGVPIIKGGQLHGTYVLDSGFDFLTPEKAEELKTSQANRGDLVITHRGTIGQVSIIPYDSLYDKYIVSQSQLKVSFDTSKINPFFVNYFFRSHLGQHRLLANASQVGVPAISKASTSVKAIMIPCPSLKEQDKVVDYLKALDDKIELNRQMNETLEVMAQALFKSWFVDFDTVIDNALAAGNDIPDEFAERAEQRKGTEKKDNSDIQNLFPNEFVFTEEMGWIPKGWEVKNLTEIAEFQNGFAFYTTGYSESGYKVVDLANIHTDGRFIETHRDKHVSPEIYNLPKHEKHRLYKNDIVMAMTDMTQAMGILGKCGKIYESDKYILNQRIGRIRVKEGININFLLTYLNSSYQLNFLKTRVLGTVQKYVNTTHIKEMNFVVPQSEVMHRFGNMVDPQFNKMREADEENETLAKIRDTLLPKLMSGELRITDAADLVDEVL